MGRRNMIAIVSTDLLETSGIGLWVSALAKFGILGTDLAEIILANKTFAENSRALAMWLKNNSYN